MSRSVSGSIVINEDELAEFVRSEIDSSDFGSMMTDAASEAMSDWDLDEMQSSIQELDSSLDRHDDRIDDLERNIEQLMTIETNPSNGPVDVSPEVDAALKKQHQRIMDLEAAMLAVFEYLNDESQRLLHGHAMAFDMKIKGGE